MTHYIRLYVKERCLGLTITREGVTPGPPISSSTSLNIQKRHGRVVIIKVFKVSLDYRVTTVIDLEK